MGENRSTLNRLVAQAREVFMRWERLRIPYNALLAAVVLFPTGGGFHWPDLAEIPILLLGAVLANLCFLAGPAAEAYLAWVGIRSKLVTAALFVGGVLVSIPCVYFFGFSVVLMNS
ncbi:MAG: hypothetical protein MUO23_03305 [Anaerolineales bacterium]|nr:hypothetical protein [Anaerolineales bacterium]